MSKLKTAILISIVCAFLYGCSNSNEPTEVKDPLLGEWITYYNDETYGEMYKISIFTEKLLSEHLYEIRDIVDDYPVTYGLVFYKKQNDTIMFYNNYYEEWRPRFSYKIGIDSQGEYLETVFLINPNNKRTDIHRRYKLVIEN